MESLSKRRSRSYRLPGRSRNHHDELLGLPGALADGNGRRSSRRCGRRLRRQYRRSHGCGARYPVDGPGAQRFVVGTRVAADEERPGTVRVSRSIDDVRRRDVGTSQPRRRKPIGPARRRRHQNCRDRHPGCPSSPRRDYHHRTPSRDHSREPAGGARSPVRSERFETGLFIIGGTDLVHWRFQAP